MDTKFPRMPVPVCVQAPKTTNTAITTDYISIGKAHKVTFLCQLKQASAHATTVSIYQATAAGGTGAKAIGNTMPIYANNNIAGNSYLTRQTDASAYSVNATASDKLVVFEVDPAALDTANSFDFVALHIAASGKSTNYASVVAIVENRNGGYDEVDLLS